MRRSCSVSRKVRPLLFFFLLTERRSSSGFGREPILAPAPTEGNPSCPQHAADPFSSRRRELPKASADPCGTNRPFDGDHLCRAGGCTERGRRCPRPSLSAVVELRAFPPSVCSFLLFPRSSCDGCCCSQPHAAWLPMRLAPPQNCQDLGCCRCLPWHLSLRSQVVTPFPIMPSVQIDAATLSRTQAHVLDACNLDLTALNLAKNLREVIAQVESGQVEEIRKRYGSNTWLSR
jgi:hypothetical protein